MGRRVLVSRRRRKAMSARDNVTAQHRGAIKSQGKSGNAKPQALHPRFTAMPAELKALAQWVLWRYALDKNGRWTKIPMRVDGQRKASSTYPDTWASFERVAAAYHQFHNVDGVGFVLTDQDPVVGIDLDHVFNDAGGLKPWVTCIMDLLHTYTERSPSGEGLRLFAFGALPSGRRKVGDIEGYTKTRVLTVTGHGFGAAKPIAERTPELAEFHIQHLTPKPKPSPQRRAPRPEAARSQTGGREGKPLPDYELVRQMLSSASGARLRALWRGDWDGLYLSQSEADLALVSSLSWWCQGDAAQVDRLFRQSGMYRPKWDRVDYQQRTMLTAGC